MLPVAIINSYNTAQASLVNTTLPGSVVAHVPYDNVAPSISNSQVNNNASPNSEAIAASEEQPPIAVPQPDSEEQAPLPAPMNSAAQNQGGGAATFLAQLMSQDGSVPAQVVLVQYEKLIALSNVKYKPSNALKPLPAPANLFGQILQGNKAAPTVQPVQQPSPPPTPAAATPDIVAEETVSASPAAAAPAPQPKPVQIRVTLSANTATAASQSGPNAAAQIIHAYTETASRLTAQSLETTTELA